MDPARCTMAWLLAGLVAMTTAGLQAGPVVVTKYGKVQGIDADGAAIFYSVPFASPPVGPLRWANPVAPKSWGSDTYDATVLKPACSQYNCEASSPPLVCPKTTSEDCLYLDIFAPGTPPPPVPPPGVNASGWPVMVYVHGGNFQHMSGNSKLFDGRKLAAEKQVILVNVNYRLGALGFLVTGQTEGDAIGNYGVLDQQQALKWVQENIHSFGGDASRVTLFGQSAGAQSTLIHLTLPDSAPYFRNAIVESSPLAIPYKRFPEAILLGALFAELVGCKPRDMNCLRSKPAHAISVATDQTRKEVASLKLLEFFEPWGPFVDGQLIKGEPLRLIQAGQVDLKPLIVGTCSEETVLYIFAAWNSSVNDAKYAEVVLATYPGHVLDIMLMYPPSLNPQQDQRNTMVKMSTDLVFACPTRNATRTMKSQGLNSLWLYEWDHAFSFPGWGPLTFCEGRVCHGSEIVYLFHSAWAGNFSFTPDEERLSDLLMDYWTNFAKTGDPNVSGERGGGRQHHLQRSGGGGGGGGGYRGKKGGPRGSKNREGGLEWPAYGAQGNWPILRFKTPDSSVEADYHGAFCNFWDSVGYAA